MYIYSSMIICYNLRLKQGLKKNFQKSTHVQHYITFNVIFHLVKHWENWKSRKVEILHPLFISLCTTYSRCSSSIRSRIILR